MKILNLLNKTIATILFVIIFFYTSQVKSLDKFSTAERLANYFSGILLLNENQYDESFKFLRKLIFVFSFRNSGEIESIYHEQTLILLFLQ